MKRSKNSGSPKPTRTPNPKARKAGAASGPKPVKPLTVACDAKAFASQIGVFAGLLGAVRSASLLNGALSYVLITAKDGKLTLHGTDLESSLTVTLDLVDVTADGQVAVPLIPLLEAVKRSTASTANIASAARSSCNTGGTRTRTTRRTTCTC